ncbi:MAG TPA: radical SAM protein [Paenibacillus sp.]|uniref:B12-binding domain-containing radical SAM protein n=1 Tax=Paenibacillus sp. TaxID=58172 RepID=UPI002C4ACD0F|nr:radical SAM protein [Paenibacillus sp.]HUC92004.1 radical SAM protein [Paenibacillus sp.]
MRNMDALIINPSARTHIYQGLSNNLAAVEPPIWAALIANYLRAKQFGVGLIDAEAEGLTVAETAKRAGDAGAKLVVVVVYGQQPSASTQNMYGAGLLCTAIKEAYPGQKVIMVGGHVSALPKRTLLEENVDFVAQGEGLQTIAGLLEADMSDSSQLAKVAGLWYMDGKEAVFTFPAPIVPQAQMVTEMPGMAFDLLPMANYRAHNWHCFDSINDRQPYASVYTSLGCPFSCSFCCINAPFGKSSFRYWDPQFMIGQFDLLAEQYGVKNIKIADEMFVMNENHFLTLSNLLIERNHGFNIWAYSRVDTVKPKYLETLKAAGVNWLALGIESGSKYVRDGVTKGRFGQEDIRSIVRQIKDAGINVIGNYIFGLPDDNYETMQQTLDLSIELNCEMANFYSAMAYPGSKLYDMALQDGLPLPESWLGYSQHAFETLPLPTKHVTAGEVLSFRDKAWQTYFTNPTYLQYVKDKFGEATHEHIVDMTKYELKRKYAEPLKV